MAAGYALRYYKDYGLHEHVVRLEIYRKYKETAFAPAPVEIGGVLTALNLNIQGEQDDVTAAILKTNLEIGLVDAPGIEYGRKTGDWEEFYTPDSTEFLVRLYIDGTLEWSGYITPDSFEEDITEYGVVTIVARDNIGHLQDFVFSENGNEEGMISVSELINKAWDLIECPMTLIVPDENDVIWPECYGYKPYDIMFNAEAFKEMAWLEVIENMADSLGMAIRYVGGNRIVMVPLRSLPLLDKTLASEVEVSDVLFEASGHRSLVPACKKIVDILKYEHGNIYEFDLADDDYQRVTLTINDSSAETWEPSENALWFRNGNIGVLNPYEFGKNPRGGASFSDPDNMFVSVLNAVSDENYLALMRSFMAGEQMLDISFTFDGRFYSAGYSSQYISIGSARQQTVTLYYSIQCYTCVDGVCGQFWFDMEKNEFIDFSSVAEEVFASAVVEYGQASTTGRYGSQSVQVKHSVRVPEGTTSLRFRFLGFTASVQEAGAVVRPAYTPIQDLIDAGKAYCRVSDLVISQDEADNYKDSTVTSLYDDSQNVLIERSPKFGPGPVVLSAKVIQNGIYLPESGYPPASEWNWPDSDVITRLQVLIHQQILLYNSKPNNLLTGTLLAEGDMVKLNSLWRFNNKLHILIGGSLDLLSGYIEDAQLREYVEWGELYPEPYKLITEDGYDVLTENSEIVIIGVKE